MGDFYGTGFEIWVGFGPGGITEKTNIWEDFFKFSWAEKRGKVKNIEAPALKSYIK